MSQLILTKIKRDDPVPLWGSIPIVVKFENEMIGGPYWLPPGNSIDLSLPLPDDVPQPTLSAPFNISGKFQIFIYLPSSQASFRTFPITNESDPVDAFSQQLSGERHLSVSSGAIIYTIHYSLVNQGAKLIALKT